MPSCLQVGKKAEPGGNQLPSHRRGGVSEARGGVSNFNTPPVSTPRPLARDPAPKRGGEPSELAVVINSPPIVGEG